MTDEEIEKALNCCKKESWDYCCNCHYIDVPDCGNALIQDSIDYIERLKDEIAGLTGALEAKQTDCENLTRTLEECNEELKAVREETAKEILQVWYRENQAKDEEQDFVLELAEEYGVEVEE